MMLAAVCTYHAGPPQVVIAGPTDRDDTRALVEATRSKYRPGAVIVPVAPERRAALVRLLPWIESMDMRDGRATAYVCENYACLQPVNTPEELAAQLSGETGLTAEG